MNKLTKIIATIGPSCESPEMIETLIKKGVNVFRFNFKHNTVEWHGDLIQRVNKVAKKMGVHIGTLIDLQGPELRINMPVDEISLKEGEVILFGEEIYKKKEKGLSITHPDIIQYLKDGQNSRRRRCIQFPYSKKRKKNISSIGNNRSFENT